MEPTEDIRLESNCERKHRNECIEKTRSGKTGEMAWLHLRQQASRMILGSCAAHQIGQCCQGEFHLLILLRVYFWHLNLELEGNYPSHWRPRICSVARVLFVPGRSD